MKKSKSCDVDLSDFTECQNCEYKYSTTLGLPRSMEGDSQDSFGIQLGDRQKRVGLWTVTPYEICTPSTQQTLLIILRAEKVATYLLLHITMTHHAGHHRTKSPLGVSVVSPQSQLFCKVLSFLSSSWDWELPRQPKQEISDISQSQSRGNPGPGQQDFSYPWRSGFQKYH